MTHRFLKKYLVQPNQIKDRWYLRPLKKILTTKALWTLRSKTVKPGFALGLFIAFIPFPVHTITAILAAARLNINLPAAILGTLACNPFTVGPMFYLAYRFGAYLLQLNEENFKFALTYTWLKNSFLNIWEPLLLGSFFLGLFSAIIGYIVMGIFWRIGIVNYLKKKSR